MQTRISFVLAALLFIGLSFLSPEKAFSQSGRQQEYNTQTNEQANHQDNPAYVKGITSGRAKSLIVGVMALASLVIGWRAKVQSTRGIANKRTAAIVASSLGTMSVLLSVWHLSTSAGAVFGSGSGKAGAIIALLLGFIGIVISTSALRIRKTGRT